MIKNTPRGFLPLGVFFYLKIIHHNKKQQQ